MEKFLNVTWIQTALQHTKKTEDICSDMTKYAETRFVSSNYKLDRPLPKIKMKKYLD